MLESLTSLMPVGWQYSVRPVLTAFLRVRSEHRLIRNAVATGLDRILPRNGHSETTEAHGPFRQIDGIHGESGVLPCLLPDVSRSGSG